MLDGVVVCVFRVSCCISTVAHIASDMHLLSCLLAIFGCTLHMHLCDVACNARRAFGKRRKDVEPLFVAVPVSNCAPGRCLHAPT
jgi:CO dehydrogenase/acetyl-CoA synthase alpha subunit